MKKTIIYLSFFTILLYGCNKINSPLNIDLTHKTESNGIIKYYYKDSLFTGTAYSYRDNKLSSEWFYNNGLYNGHIEYESDGEIGETVEMIIGNQRYVNEALDYNPNGVTRKQTSFNFVTHEILEIEYETWDNCSILDSFDYSAPSSHYRKINYFRNGMVQKDYISVEGKARQKLEYQLTKDGGRCMRFKEAYYYDWPRTVRLYQDGSDRTYNCIEEHSFKDENCRWVQRSYELDDGGSLVDFYDTTNVGYQNRQTIIWDLNGNIVYKKGY